MIGQLFIFKIMADELSSYFHFIQLQNWSYAIGNSRLSE
jgi:hypothetical protein